MKIKLLLSAFVLLGMNAQAQFFQYLYQHQDSRLYSGVNVRNLPQGHFMTGTNFTAANTLGGVYTDEFGGVPGGPYFNNTYSLLQTPNSPLGKASWTQSFEINTNSPPSQGFGVIGIYDPAAQTGIFSGRVFYLNLDQNGNPVFVKEYLPVATPGIWDASLVTQVAQSSTGNEVYVTGTMINHANNNFRMFAMKIDIATGNLIWSNIYDLNGPTANTFEVGTGIVENPAVNEVAVCGTINWNSSGGRDGFFLRLNPTNGNPAFGWVIYYGTTTSNDAFGNMQLANSPTPTSTGYIISGYSNLPGNTDAWLTKINTTGGSIWSKLYDYGSNPGIPNYSGNVIERLNTSNNYEYYLCGEAYTSATSSDAYVMKVDNAGTPVAGGEFEYGIAGNMNYARNLDQYNGTAYDGLSVYSYTEDPSALKSMYHIKAYFNGLSGCNENFNTPLAQNGPGIDGESQINILTQFTDNPINVSVGTGTDKQLCYSNSITGGDNSRVAKKDQEKDNMAAVSPNPVYATNGSASVTVQSAITTDATISVYDMLGKQYLAQPYILTGGKNEIHLNLRDAGMAAGTYIVKINGSGINTSIKMMVK